MWSCGFVPHHLHWNLTRRGSFNTALSPRNYITVATVSTFWRKHICFLFNNEEMLLVYFRQVVQMLEPNILLKCSMILQYSRALFNIVVIVFGPWQEAVDVRLKQETSSIIETECFFLIFNPNYGLKKNIFCCLTTAWCLDANSKIPVTSFAWQIRHDCWNFVQWTDGEIKVLQMKM